MTHTEHGHRPRKLAMTIGGRGYRGEKFGGQGAHGHHRGGGRRGRLFGPGELRLVLLHLISETPRHGYELIKAIEELAGGAYAPSPGLVYPTLSMLADEGMTMEAEGGGARKAFAITDMGRAEVAERRDDVAALLERLKGVGEADAQRSSPPVARAVGNLMTVIRIRAASGELDRETAHHVAEILDDAARRIERL